MNERSCFRKDEHPPSPKGGSQKTANSHRMWHCDNLAQIKQIVQSCPILSKEEEVVCAKQMAAGDNNARTKLIESNLRLVVHIARKFDWSDVPIEDRVQQGVIGLISAIEKFDIQLGHRLSTYAIHYITSEIKKALNQRGIVRLPRHILQDIKQYREAENHLVHCYSSQPTTSSEILEHLQISYPNAKWTEKKLAEISEIAYSCSGMATLSLGETEAEDVSIEHAREIEVAASINDGCQSDIIPSFSDSMDGDLCDRCNQIAKAVEQLPEMQKNAVWGRHAVALSMYQDENGLQKHPSDTPLKTNAERTAYSLGIQKIRKILGGGGQ